MKPSRFFLALLLPCLAFGIIIAQTVPAVRPISAKNSPSQGRYVKTILRGVPAHVPELPPAVPPAASESGLPLPHTMSSIEYQKLLYKFLDERVYQRKLQWPRDKKVRDTGPYIDGKSYGTHNSVRIFYSPDVIEWMEGGRKGAIPDGAMIIKEMFAPPAARYDSITGEALDSLVTSWAVMVRDHQGSLDGWYWSFYYPGQPIDDPDRYPYDYPNSDFGEYCVRCHASTASEFTFADLRNVEGHPGEPLTFRVDDSWVSTGLFIPTQDDHMRLALGTGYDGLMHPSGPNGVNAEFVQMFDEIATVALEDVQFIPPVTYDHVIVGPNGPEQFITSDQCLSCHDGQPPNLGPNMYIPLSDTTGINLSPYGEWNWSMMGLAGRDPIFYSQIESELNMQPQHADLIQNTCFRCHGVMGQRQFAIDHPTDNFSKEFPFIKDENDPYFKYGALARDGVSCALCHQIVDDKLPLDSIYTGRFKVSTPGEFEKGISYVYGPFEDPAVLAMESSLGMKPVQNDYIKESRLCGGCHTVNLPVFDRTGKQVGNVFEQATYLEWQNSDYQTEFGGGGKTPKSCQNCHMPTTFPYSRPDTGMPLIFRIANIQDQTYPEADHRAPMDSITIPLRPEFARHSLLGVNQFALEMFNQFDYILGVRKTDYMTSSKSGLPFAIEVSDRLAKQHTATVEVTGVKETGEGLEATVRVTNLTGHRMPSGVGFRRAFLEFKVIDAHNAAVWPSGATNSVGVIIDGKGKPLPSEFLEVDPKTGEQQYEPHYEVITRQDQVQIYQELSKSPEGTFTTSFLNIFEHVKDNRLLPIGWTKSGPSGFKYPEATMPHGDVLNDKVFMNGTGSDEITYRVKLPKKIVKGARVIATLYYQSIPPYYLRDRFTIAPNGKGTQRLHYLASHLSTEGTNIEDWKLMIGTAQMAVK